MLLLPAQAGLLGKEIGVRGCSLAERCLDGKRSESMSIPEGAQPCQQLLPLASVPLVALPVGVLRPVPPAIRFPDCWSCLPTS
jgi:hypothetical protein